MRSLTFRRPTNGAARLVVIHPLAVRRGGAKCRLRPLRMTPGRPGGRDRPREQEAQRAARGVPEGLGERRRSDTDSASKSWRRCAAQCLYLFNIYSI